MLLEHAKSLPSYATEQSAGLDLPAAIPNELIISPGESSLIPTGICMSIPVGYEGQVRPRSSMALKNKVTVLNAPGTIDSDYRGEVKVLLINLGKDPFVIRPGDRIAQMVFAKYETAEIVLTQSIDQTSRGSGGFGSTGA